MTTTDTVELAGIGQIAVVVRDVDRAERFYRDALSLRHLFRAPVDLTFFECGGVRLMLSRAESPEFAHASSILYFTVAGIERVHAVLSGRGVVFRDAPHVVADLGTRVLWLAFFEDGEGNVLALMEEKAK